MDALRQICGFYFLAPTTCQIGALHSNRVTEAKKYNMMPQQVKALDHLTLWLWGLNGTLYTFL